MPYYAAMGCGFQTGAGTVLNVLKPEKDDSVVIFGSGGVGLSAIMAAKSLGVEQIVAVDLLEKKLELAKSVGATLTINPAKVPDVVKEIKELCKKNSGATYAIDCTGVLKVIEQCIECLAPCGTAVTVGVPPTEAKISIDPLTFLLENKRYSQQFFTGHTANTRRVLGKGEDPFIVRLLHILYPVTVPPQGVPA